MTKKSIMLGILGLAVAGAAIYSTTALAYRGNPDEKGPNYTPERHEQMEKAFENKDYGTWKNLMDGRGRVSEVINEANFGLFAQMHKFMEEGNSDEAEKIRQELGLGQKNGQGKGMMGGQRGQNRNGNFVDKDGDGTCDRMQ